VLGCIADDVTGATDLATNLVQGGMRVVQVVGIPDSESLSQLHDVDAVVVALKTRTVSAELTVEQSLVTLPALQSRGVLRFYLNQPSKEAFLHVSMYRSRPNEQAIVHLHSTHSVAVSCLDGIDHTNTLPSITAYYDVMRVGTLPLIPYFAPGGEQLAAAVEQAAKLSKAVLLSNQSPVVSDKHRHF